MFTVKILRAASLLALMLNTSAMAFQMGMPGIVGQDKDVVMSASTGIRYNLLLDEPGPLQFDSIFQYDVLGKIGFAPVKWFMPVLMVGGSSYYHKRSDFKGVFSPEFGLQLRIAPVNNDKGFFFSIDPGLMYQPIRGSIGNIGNLKAKKLDFAAGLTFGYNLDRMSFYAGGRYSFLWLKEDRAIPSKTAHHYGGIYGGIDYFVTPNVFFNVEAQNFDAQAVYVGVGGRF